ncbi:MAG: MGMT family protein [Anaerolineaceae bacterium]|nr:MGMT family protein [Anaerolineaceae bacterium]
MAAQARFTYEEIYQIVRLIPKGNVATYGQIAAMHGGCGARQVGYALHHLKEIPHDAEVPWQRVINARGEVSLHGGGLGSSIQMQLLAEEGIEFDVRGRVDFERYQWVPDFEAGG